ncbi:MAG: GRP family sugar transporter [Acidimicrobiales bacterium]
MTALLALITVSAWGTWIPLAQAVPGVPQRSRTFYVTVGNVVFALVALFAGGGHLGFGWRDFWLPFAGGLVWTLGSHSAFRASEDIGLARAAGSWTPLNIVTAFVWGVLVFHELSGFSQARLAVVAGALVLVLVGVLLIVSSQEVHPRDVPNRGDLLAPTVPARDKTASVATTVGSGSTYRRGLLWAAAAGVLWGSYFVPAQWAKVPSEVANFPLALGILASGAALALSAGEPVRLSRKVTVLQLSAGVLFGAGNLALLGLVSRVGTGVGFTIAQLSLLVNASIGIWVFKVPKPGSRAARVAIAGILIAGVGGGVIGAVR